MRLNIIIRATADTKEELLNTFTSQYAAMREHMEGLLAHGMFGPPNKTQLHFLLTGGKWTGDESAPGVLEIVEVPSEKSETLEAIEADLAPKPSEPSV